MGGPYEERLPEDLQGIDARLSDNRCEIEPLRLDQLKQRALAQSSSRNGRRIIVKSRLATILTALVLLGGTGSALAIALSDVQINTSGGAASVQYKPGKGCGDKNHKHQKDNCK